MPPSTRGGPGWVTEPCFSRSRGRGPGGFGSGWGWGRAPSVPPHGSSRSGFPQALCSGSPLSWLFQQQRSPSE